MNTKKQSLHLNSPSFLLLCYFQLGSISLVQIAIAFAIFPPCLIFFNVLL